MRREVTELLQHNVEHVHRFRSRFDEVQDAQRPEAVTVCCSDSRVLQDHMWGNETPGRLFTCGNIGNRVVQRSDAGIEISGDVLYPIEHTDTEIIIVVGHTGCGAIAATYDTLTGGGTEPAGIAHCLDLLRPSVEPGIELLPEELGRSAAVNRLVEYNVDRQIESLNASNDVPDAITLVGAVYDFQDVYPGHRGEVHVINVDGETTVNELRERHPGIDARIARHWVY